jgi:dTDP-4-amino-4,6-dideoxygalactose transaminase
MSVPMVDLKLQYDAIKGEIDAAVLGVLESTSFILGPQGKALEQQIAAYHGVRHAIGVASGTDALHLALRAADIGPGDEVITTPFTFIATAEAVSYVGAVPVFVDIEPDTFNMDVKQIERRITKRTKAILPVHLYGHPANMTGVMEIAQEHKLRVIEDCAQSFGAEFRRRKTGSFGDLGCFSFFPSKNLGCFGDGGMVVTDDQVLAGTMRMIAAHGSRVRYYHEVLGLNSRLDTLQAAILLAKLPHLEEYNAARRRAAARYDALLKGLPVAVPVVAPDVVHIFHQYTLRVPERDGLAAFFRDKGIPHGIYYPVPLHLQRAFAMSGGKKGDFPVTEKASEEVISLPMHTELTEEQLLFITGALREFYG